MFQATYIGTATVLLEIGSLRLLTDPAFDPEGGRYSFGFGTRSKKTHSPAIDPKSLGRIDAVLLSHDHHADNLDHLGREFLKSVPHVITTVPGARRLAGQSTGLKEWQCTELQGSDGFSIRITATPARHGPRFSLPIAGKVNGFVLEWKGQSQGALYISGDTVLFGGINEIAKRFQISTAFLHVGGVAFPWLTGGIRYTFNAHEAIQAARILKASTIVPIHYEGWSHFKESSDDMKKQLNHSLGTERELTWLVAGQKTQLS